MEGPRGLNPPSQSISGTRQEQGGTTLDLLRGSSGQDTRLILATFWSENRVALPWIILEEVQNRVEGQFWDKNREAPPWIFLEEVQIGVEEFGQAQVGTTLDLLGESLDRSGGSMWATCPILVHFWTVWDKNRVAPPWIFLEEDQIRAVTRSGWHHSESSWRSLRFRSEWTVNVGHMLHPSAFQTGASNLGQERGGTTLQLLSGSQNRNSGSMSTTASIPEHFRTGASNVGQEQGGTILDLFGGGSDQSGETTCTIPLGQAPGGTTLDLLGGSSDQSRGFMLATCPIPLGQEQGGTTLDLHGESSDESGGSILGQERGYTTVQLLRGSRNRNAGSMLTTSSIPEYFRTGASNVGQEQGGPTLDLLRGGSDQSGGSMFATYPIPGKNRVAPPWIFLEGVEIGVEGWHHPESSRREFRSERRVHVGQIVHPENFQITASNLSQEQGGTTPDLLKWSSDQCGGLMLATCPIPVHFRTGASNGSHSIYYHIKETTNKIIWGKNRVALPWIILEKVQNGVEGPFGPHASSLLGEEQSGIIQDLCEGSLHRIGGLSQDQDGTTPDLLKWNSDWSGGLMLAICPIPLVRTGWHHPGSSWRKFRLEWRVHGGHTSHPSAFTDWCQQGKNRVAPPYNFSEGVGIGMEGPFWPHVPSHNISGLVPAIVGKNRVAPPWIFLEEVQIRVEGGLHPPSQFILAQCYLGQEQDGTTLDLLRRSLYRSGGSIVSTCPIPVHFWTVWGENRVAPPWIFLEKVQIKVEGACG
ncbi:hypothetical protein K438DRAFT_1758638 [Mycena galopus ATCC 62051]|nr:hypothetical protein K438DRAFT_1758638 [Mycena galopus ATCC 62051]